MEKYIYYLIYQQKIKRRKGTIETTTIEIKQPITAPKVLDVVEHILGYKDTKCTIINYTLLNKEVLNDRFTERTF